MKLIHPFAAIASAAFFLSSCAEQAPTRPVGFKAGETKTVISGTVAGDGSVLYQLPATEGQSLSVTLKPENPSTEFNLYRPGTGPGDEALFISATAGRTFTGRITRTGDHTISVFLNRVAARRGETSAYQLHVALDGKPAAAREESPSTGPVPQKVIDDCLAALVKQVGGKKMTVISSKRGETSFIVEVRVTGAEKPWRCFHDGTRCTGTEYQGEG
ncbi:MAG: hypothetical protein V4584_07025 [Verrucomicrobiota bacterium]